MLSFKLQIADADFNYSRNAFRVTDADFIIISRCPCLVWSKDSSGAKMASFSLICPLQEHASFEVRAWGGEKVCLLLQPTSA